MRRKVVVTVSAMIVAAQLGSPLAAAQPTVDQLGDIAGYLSSNDVQGLRNYLSRYPDLADGDTTLARLLREFLAESADVTTYLGFKPNLARTLDDDGPSPRGSIGAAEDPDVPAEPVY